MRQMQTALAVGAIAFAGLMAIAAPAYAQQSSGSSNGGIVPQRDCQTVLTCNFKRGGRYRGCLSSYSCRSCDFETVRCRDGSRRICREVRCGWGA